MTLINRRFLDQISDSDRSRWPLAGDQVIVDFDIGHDNLAAGDRLMLGTALAEVTAKPHTGCIKFVRRYGVDAQRFVGSDVGRRHRLRGIYVRIITDGTAGVGDLATKVNATG